MNFPKTEIMGEYLQITTYKVKCTEFMAKWHCLLNYDTLEEWFDTNRCCLPIVISRLLDKGVIKANTTI